MTTIRITDLTLKAIIGTNDWERTTKQTVIINAEIQYRADKAIATDNIKEAIDYKAITKKIIARVKASKFFLIESLAQCALDIIMENKKVKRASVRVDKPRALRFAKSVSVEVSATR